MVGTNARSTVLLVEDEMELQELIAGNLRELNFEVLTATNGRSAYAELEAHHRRPGAPLVEAIISDWMMPEGDGIELLSRVRGGPFRSVPFLLISGAVTHEQMRFAMGFDVDVILLKPFPLTELRQKITEASERREKRELERMSAAQ